MIHRHHSLPNLVLAALLGAACAAPFLGCPGRPGRVELYTNYRRDVSVTAALRHVAQALRTESGGRVTLSVPLEEPTQEERRQTAKRALLVELTTTQGLSRSYPPLGAVDAPYMFRDLEHFDAVMESELGRELVAEGQRRAEIQILDVWVLGVRQVTLRDRAATTPEGFSGVKLRVPPGPMFVEGARALGAQPTTMALDDVYTALRIGTVDGQENGLAAIKLRRLNEVCRYLIMTHHMIGTSVPCIADSVWEQIDPEAQSLIRRCFREAKAVNRAALLQEEREIIREMEHGGMIVLRPNLDPFRRRARHTWKRYRQVWGDSLATRVQSIRPDSTRSALGTGAVP